MISDSATLVLFAIRSAIKLGQQSRQAYVDSTRRRELTLPLPNFFVATDADDAVGFFRNPGLGKKYVEGYVADGRPVPPDTVLAALLPQYDPLAPVREVERRLMDYHVKYKNVYLAEQGTLERSREPGSVTPNPQETLALLSIQQWRKGTDPTPSTLHRIAGTLIEIGIDYALTSPDLFDKNSQRGKALVGFLTALEQIDFKEGELAELPARLFVATLETVAQTPELISGDPKIQELVQVTTREISTNAGNRIKAIQADPALKDHPDKQRDALLRVQAWGELIFRSTLASGGRLVLSDPGRFLGVPQGGHQALISSVGNSVLDLVLDGDRGLEGLLSRQGVETILQAALKTVGEHPEILGAGGNDGVKKLITGVATELSQVKDLLTVGALPEVARLVLEKTGENLALFWPDLAADPARNLVLVAARTTLQILTRPADDGAPWKVRLRRTDLLLVTEAVLDQLVANPGWLLDEAHGLSPVLGEVLQAAMEALRERGDERLSPALAAEVLRVMLGTLVRRPEFAGTLDNHQPLVAAVIEAVIAAVFAKNLPPAAAWQLVGAEVVKGILQVSFEKLAETDLGPEVITALQETLKAQIAKIAKGQEFDLDAFGKALARKLAA